MGDQMMGRIAFFSSNRPPLPLDLCSCPIPNSSTSKQHETCLTDSRSSYYNGQATPSLALEHILNRPFFSSQSIPNKDDIDSGLVFVSERAHNLETLHLAIHFQNQVKVFNLADIYDTFQGVRMEDSPCFAGNDYLIYVSTKEPASRPRQPWTAVYKTYLVTGETQRLTPSDVADLNPSASPSGKRIAVATFGDKDNWNGEVEDLKTSIVVMEIEEPCNRKLVVTNGGWPSWGSDDVLFFHRKEGGNWAVFQAQVFSGEICDSPTRVTPEGLNAITPAAIDSNKVAVATYVCEEEQEHFRHIEIFDTSYDEIQRIYVTAEIGPETDHFNPFVIEDRDGGKHVGYHRYRIESDHEEDFGALQEVTSPDPKIGLVRTSVVFPTFSNDGTKLAFVDDEFKAVWLANSHELRVIYEMDGPEVSSLSWNQNPEKDILYLCLGSLKPDEPMHISALFDVSHNEACVQVQLTKDHNNAFPSTNPDGTRLVFRSNRDVQDAKRYKNLYIMDAESGEYGYESGVITRLTEGKWIDTHCHWSPRGDWIVFSSNRDKLDNVPGDANEHDPRYYTIFLVNANKKDVVVRVIGNGSDLSGHVNRPFFSPDGTCIVMVAADLVGVSVDPISLRLFSRGGDIFAIKIDTDDINKNKDVKKSMRITHSRYENSIGSLTWIPINDEISSWNQVLSKLKDS